MRNLKTILLREINDYEQLLKEARDELNKYTEKVMQHRDEAGARIYVDNRKGFPQYYFVLKDAQSGKTVRKYVRKDRME